MTPADLPQFTVTEVLPDRCIGRFSPSPWVNENWIAGLHLGEHRFLWGRFCLVFRDAAKCSFSPNHPNDLARIRVGTTYPYIDGYWGERAELVLDAGRAWKQREFEPSDMVMLPGSDGTTFGTSAVGDGPVGTIVPGAWDHEHCDVCNRKIGCGGEAEGYFSTPDAWVCEECHSTYVLPRSIAFAELNGGWPRP